MTRYTPNAHTKKWHKFRPQPARRRVDEERELTPERIEKAKEKIRQMRAEYLKKHEIKR